MIHYWSIDCLIKDQAIKSVAVGRVEASRDGTNQLVKPSRVFHGASRVARYKQ